MVDDTASIYGLGQKFRDSLRLSRCPYCSISNPYVGRLHKIEENPAHQVRKTGIWGIFRCNSCGGIVIARAPNMNLQGGNSSVPGDIDKIIPESKQASDLLPITARTYLQQAIDTLHAPDAAAVMAGSAVDAMLKHLNYEEGSVYKRIEQAVKDGVLTKNMAEWAHSVRLGANRPRHADSERPHIEMDEAKRSVEFAEALGDFLFVLSAKIEKAIVASNPA